MNLRADRHQKSRTNPEQVGPIATLVGILRGEVRESDVG